MSQIYRFYSNRRDFPFKKPNDHRITHRWRNFSQKTSNQSSKKINNATEKMFKTKTKTITITKLDEESEGVQERE